MGDSFPISDDLLERVRSGKELRDVGRIDLREAGRVTSATLHRAIAQHCSRFRYGHEAPIRLREEQAKSLARDFGFDSDDRENPIDVTEPGSRFCGHELWIDPSGVR